MRCLAPPVQYSMVPYRTVPNCIVPYRTIPYRTVSSMQYALCSEPYRAVPCLGDGDGLDLDPLHNMGVKTQDREDFGCCVFVMGEWVKPL